MVYKKRTVKSGMSSSPKVTSKESGHTTTNNSPQSCIQLPHFWGTEDYIEASDWMELYDAIATDYGWSPSNKAIRLGGYLRKHALVWYIQTTSMYPIESTQWHVYKDLFKKRFNPVKLPLEKSSSRDATT